MKMMLSLLVLLMATSTWATTQDDVNFAQRQCQQRNDPDKCATYRAVAKAYQREQRDALEHDAAIKAKQAMAGANYTDIETNVYSGDGKGAYRWNGARNKYCYHNSNGSVQRCVN
ncbi:hypothetical protein LVJ82_16630 [Vitreoscilla massiliensis]|uniref:Uncharacterized protein n=1 Tax=Vitreoscilla massiliensis TaxID=1689272 RepID=A0ABY4DZV7_9NEIS|nr:hypothetical protein [Vitreoscilla massiliensis]UOO89050.1 hypothetical protein LVJ82_16630 [Vitreoscilla massiliensis]